MKRKGYNATGVTFSFAFAYFLNERRPAYGKKF